MRRVSAARQAGSIRGTAAQAAGRQRRQTTEEAVHEPRVARSAMSAPAWPAHLAEGLDVLGGSLGLPL